LTVLGFLEVIENWVALAATDKRIFNILMRFGAIGAYANPFPKPEKSGFDFTRKDHVRASVCTGNIRNRTGLAIFYLPGWVGIAN